MDAPRDPVVLFGCGALGMALGRRLARWDWPLAGIWNRTHERALEATLWLGCPAFPRWEQAVSRAGLLILAIPPEGVQAWWPRIAPRLPPGAVAAHVGLEGPGRLVGAALPLGFRPLSRLSPEPAAGVMERVALEGPPEALARGRRLAEGLGLTALDLGALRRRLARSEGLEPAGVWGAAGARQGLSEEERAELVALLRAPSLGRRPRAGHGADDLGGRDAEAGVDASGAAGEAAKEEGGGGAG